ncbi:FAD-dependent monooxygenase (plasmid) [Rhodococcus pyridinivorans]|uniref:FAD-dependent monooxygenase n=1 Tax=Rhodococcus pyridinivorans TaxID=103816 RepID=UPI001FFFB7EB|nr:FAD-dependent monooxygenase [Rhodococcus pyridinivorans]UPK66468.1 FAD-dependent monooxygenase [Rhodococcus pyridinivorans]
MDASIIVVGAGPVGTCLAIDAAMRGADVIVLESRGADDPPDAKCNTIAARTMETFRRFGIANEVRAAGLPDDYPTDTVYATSLAGPLLTRIEMPSRNERDRPGFHDSNWPSPESMVRESQLWLEPILRAKLKSCPTVQFVPRTEFVGYSQDADGVTVHCRTLDDDRYFDLRAAYLAGCDGGSSRVRKAMGVGLVGDAEIARTRTTLVRSAAIKDLQEGRRPAWMTWVVNDRVRGNVVAIDGEELWLVHRALPDGETDFDALDFDQSLRDVLGVGSEFPFEVVRHEDWVGRRLVAERFRDGRVFIAGDAAHLWVPFAGYGMNAGIADAMNLSWLLCAVLGGWADASIINAYEAERLPITEQVSRFAMAKLEENVAAISGRSVPKILSAPTIVGRFLRKRLGRKLFDINLAQMSPEGLNFGYYYDRSPIIVGDGEPAPAYDMGMHVPSTVPGCRLPHFRVGKESILDLLGPEYTLIRFDGSTDVSAIVNSALPVRVVDAPSTTHPAIRHTLLMVRPDSHVVWRGNSLPEDLSGLVDRLRGMIAA